MPRLQSEAPHLHVERARDHEGDSKTVWLADYWQGRAQAGGGGGGSYIVKQGNKPPWRPEYTKMVPKTGSFQHLLT